MNVGDDRLKDLAKLAGMDKDPRIRALTNSALLSSEGRAELVRYLGALAARRNPRPHSFLPAPDREEAERGIAEFAQVVTGVGPEYFFRFREDHFLTNVLCEAPTGGGKTVILALLGLQVHRAGTPTWWFDSEGDIMQLVLGEASDVLLVNYKDLRLSAFMGPENTGLTWREYLSKFIGTFGETLDAGEAMQNMARELALHLREQLGAFTVCDFEAALRSRRYSANSRERGYWESLMNRFGGSIVPFLGETFGSGTHDVRALLQRSVVWDVRGLSPDLLAFFMTTLLLWVWLVKDVSTQPSLENLFIFDELMRLCRQGQSRLPSANAPFFIDYLQTSRKRNIGHVLGAQSPHLLAPAILSNMNSWIALRPADGRALACVSQSLDLDRDQEEHLMALPDRDPRQAVVRCPGISQAFLVQVPSLQMNVASQDELARRRAMSCEWLKTIHTDLKSHPAAVKAAARNDVSGILERVFVRIAVSPDETCEERAAALKIDLATESAARRDLGGEGGLGLVEVIGKVSNLIFLHLTAKGRAVATEKGIKVWKDHASPPHAWLARQCIKGLARAGTVRVVERELSLNGKRPDSVVVVGNKTVALQICASDGNYESEATALLRLAEAPGVSVAVLVGSNRRRAAGIRKVLTKKLSDVGWEKIAVLDANQVLHPNFEWLTIIGSE